MRRPRLFCSPPHLRPRWLCAYRRAASTVQYTDGSAYGIDINSADEDELTALAGIGEKKAESIVSYREEHGEFIYPWEITNVDGIGEKTYEKIKNDICAD